MNISDHFTSDEVSFSQTASRNRIDNTPSPVVLANARMAAKSLERVRALLQFPILVSSWYRSQELNRLVGGVPNSQHITGEAIDFICPQFGTPADICKKIIHFPELVSFDQLILEHTWVHVSFSANPAIPNRKQVLSLLRSGHYSNGLTNSDGDPL